MAFCSFKVSKLLEQRQNNTILFHDSSIARPNAFTVEYEGMNRMSDFIATVGLNGLGITDDNVEWWDRDFRPTGVAESEI